jgi:hypothetical protein
MMNEDAFQAAVGDLSRISAFPQIGTWINEHQNMLYRRNCGDVPWTGDIPYGFGIISALVDESNTVFMHRLPKSDLLPRSIPAGQDAGERSGWIGWIHIHLTAAHHVRNIHSLLDGTGIRLLNGGGVSRHDYTFMMFAQDFPVFGMMAKLRGR